MSRIINLCREISGLPSNNATIIEGLCKVLKKYGGTPSVSSASLLSVGSDLQRFYKLAVNWSQTDFESVEKINFQTNYLVNLSGDTVTDMNILHDTTNELYSVSSNSSKLKAIIREISKDGKSNQVVEFWDNKAKVKTINGEKEKLFGKIHLSATFGSIKWSSDESRLMFVAEKYTTTCGFFDKKKNEDSKDAIEMGNEFTLKEDWGEQVEGTCHPVVCIIDVKNEYKLRTIDVPNISCSESFWIDNNTIGFVGNEETPRRLGFIFCPIRRSYLYMCDLSDPETKPVIIYGEGSDSAIRSPRVSNDSKKIVFLSNPPAGPHFQASSLMILNLQDKSVKTLIGIGDPALPEIQSPTEIHTFYCLYLPERCWASDNRKVIVTCEIGYREHLFLVDVDSGQSTHIPVQNAESVTIMDVLDDLIVLNLTKPNVGSNLNIAKLVNNRLTKLIPVDLDLCVNRDEIDYKCDIIEKNEPSVGQQLITCLLIAPKESLGKPTPTILVPHGGPHSNYLATYMPRYARMAEFGFKVILVNYRGSTGINSKHEKFLCGKVGTTDVADCMEVLNCYIQQNEVDKDQVCLYGGSHGGFLVTHLVGQHSDFGFRACVALNPVTDFAAGFSTSDIPDWHLVEGKGQFEPYSLTTIPTPDLLSDFLSVSPIIHVDKVKTPVLMALGTKDKRVAMCQGKAYYHALKARGIPTKCLVYEDNHSIGKANHDLDLEMNSILWFLDHLFKSRNNASD